MTNDQSRAPGQWPLRQGRHERPAAGELASTRARASQARLGDHPLPSHRPLGDGDEGFGQAEEVIANRLRQAGELRELQNLTQTLLKHPAFRQELEKLYKDLSPAQKERLAESAQKALRGEKVIL